MNDYKGQFYIYLMIPRCCFGPFFQFQDLEFQWTKLMIPAFFRLSFFSSCCYCCLVGGYVAGFLDRITHSALGMVQRSSGRNE